VTGEEDELLAVPKETVVPGEPHLSVSALNGNHSYQTMRVIGSYGK